MGPTRWATKSFLRDVKPLVNFKVENNTTHVCHIFNSVEPNVHALNSNNVYTQPFDSGAQTFHELANTECRPPTEAFPQRTQTVGLL
jgi:hypothetical protein